MAKFMLTIGVLLLVVAAMTIAAPAGGDSFKGEEVVQEETHNRVRRATCSLPLIAGLMNDSVCAAHCLGKGKAGGHCEDEICRCRKETLKELWDQRFG